MRIGNITNEYFDISRIVREIFSHLLEELCLSIFLPTQSRITNKFYSFRRENRRILIFIFISQLFLPCRVNYYAVNKYNHAWNLIDFEINLSLGQYSLHDANTERLIGKWGEKRYSRRIHFNFERIIALNRQRENTMTSKGSLRFVCMCVCVCVWKYLQIFFCQLIYIDISFFTLFRKFDKEGFNYEIFEVVMRS